MHSEPEVRSTFRCLGAGLTAMAVMILLRDGILLKIRKILSDCGPNRQRGRQSGCQGGRRGEASEGGRGEGGGRVEAAERCTLDLGCVTPWRGPSRRPAAPREAAPDRHSMRIGHQVSRAGPGDRLRRRSAAARIASRRRRQPRIVRAAAHALATRSCRMRGARPGGAAREAAPADTPATRMWHRRISRRLGCDPTPAGRCGGKEGGRAAGRKRGREGARKRAVPCVRVAGWSVYFRRGQGLEAGTAPPPPPSAHGPAHRVRRLLRTDRLTACPVSYARRLTACTPSSSARPGPPTAGRGGWTML